MAEAADIDDSIKWKRIHVSHDLIAFTCKRGATDWSVLSIPNRVPKYNINVHAKENFGFNVSLNEVLCQFTKWNCNIFRRNGNLNIN